MNLSSTGSDHGSSPSTALTHNPLSSRRQERELLRRLARLPSPLGAGKRAGDEGVLPGLRGADEGRCKDRYLDAPPHQSSMNAPSSFAPGTRERRSSHSSAA